MFEGYKKINKIIVWIIALSTIAYFVILPISFSRPTAPTQSPSNTIQTPQNPTAVSPSQNFNPISNSSSNAIIQTQPTIQISSSSDNNFSLPPASTSNPGLNF
ncbi:MAG: hypothetical protein M1505_01385 [Patescibacteria group bacterium]|nr:hypothetical protein [Patescibacteria group bacterium]MCL5257867.1 hypothetical protein [Patescibacteria group bacterium]